MRSPLLAVCLLLSAVLGIGGIIVGSAADAGSRAADRPRMVRDAGFVSSDACQACHPKQYASWHASYHRTMTQVATPQTAIPNFDDKMIADVHGRPMVLRRDGQRLSAEFDDPDAPDALNPRPRITRPVVLITGSHNQQIFWYATGRERLLGQLPGAYLIREQRWVPRRMAVLHPPSQQPLSETGHWNSTCIACHATHGEPRFDTPFGSQPILTQSVDTSATEFGIACEMCHGPGDAHASANRSLMRRYTLHLTGRPDGTIVQPVRLDPKRGSEVCGQCHSVWEFYGADGERQANATGLPYRPGDELSATRFVAQPTRNADAPAMRALLADDSRFIRDSFWSDGTVRVSGREYNGLIESPCYTRATTADRTLSCFSCHSMHQSDADRRSRAMWADDQLSAFPGGSDHRADADPESSNHACLQCHQAIGSQLAAHTHHAPDSPGSVCYNCHMPYTTYGLLKTIRSHTIGSPTVRESVQTGRPNACNLCHLDRTLEWTSASLQRWYGTAPVPLSNDEREVSASLLWLLKGDAGQRAIVSQAMAWPAARQASSTDWMAPFLGQLLDDPYDAVRIGAARSLGSLPGFDGFPVDVTAAAGARRQAQLRVMATWDRTRPRPGRTGPELLMTPAGDVDVNRVLALLRQRDNKGMLLRE